MNGFGLKKELLIIEVLVAVIWVAVVFLFGNMFGLGLSGIICFWFVPICLVAVYICTTAHAAIKDDSSTIGIPLYYSGVLLVISFLVNGGYIISGISSFGKYALIIDIVSISVYLVFALFSARHTEAVRKQIETTEDSKKFSFVVSKGLGVVLATIDAPDLLSKLVTLKEQVDYSSNVSRSTAVDSDILHVLKDLQEAAGTGKDSEEIERLISQLSALWQQRVAQQ